MLDKIAKFIQRTVGWFGNTSWKIKAVIMAVILIAGLLIGWRIISSKKDGYIFDTTQKRTITEVVTESGMVTTNGRVNIYSPTNGVIGKVFVANGETVSESQKLFTVKSTATPQEKTAALSAYQAAKAAVQQAENTRRATQATVDRVHDDLKDKDDTENFLQRETRTTAEVTNDNAYDALLAARAELASTEVAYQASQNATVTAPISGSISNLSVASGSGVLVNSALVPHRPY